MPELSIILMKWFINFQSWISETAIGEVVNSKVLLYGYKWIELKIFNFTSTLTVIRSYDIFDSNEQIESHSRDVLRNGCS